jgi:hypothetical protein
LLADLLAVRQIFHQLLVLGLGVPMRALAQRLVLCRWRQWYTVRFVSSVYL